MARARWTEEDYATYRRHAVGSPPPPVAPAMTHAQLQGQVREVAKRLGWERIYHTYNSKRSDSGFPDLVLCRPKRLIFAELKTEGDTATIPQQQWLDMLNISVPGIECYLWYPSDLNNIVDILQ